MSASEFPQRLTQALGADVVATSPADIEPWLSDWRGIYRGQAQAVVRPRTTDEVARCLALCQQAGVPVVPHGGNTGLCGGATPDAAQANVVLSLERMNAIRALDTVANTMVAEAGCILGNLRRAAQDANRLLPLSLAAEDSSQIGGNVATNAGGVNVVRYGMARELVLGLEAVLPNGEVLHGLRTLRKDNTGYDLKQLLIGSEGTLGVITAVALRLFPRADTRTVVLAAVESPRQALQLYELLFEQCGARLQAFEYFSGDCLDLVLTHVDGLHEPFAQRYPAYVLVELADTIDEAALNALVEEVIGAALERELCLDAAVSASLAQLQTLWRLREEISEAQRADGPHLKHDVSLPIERIPEFMETAEARVRERYPDIRPFIFGHFGDGNLHYNLSRPAGAPREWAAEQGDAVTDLVLDEVLRYGGSISAEHGIGQLKRDHFLHSKDPLELRLMREIKRVLDPAGIMNPGKLL
ncbi:oxidoreductase [Bordetella pertussis]|uniref:Oxidoreductase n=1 Tax=Bordetella pertussis (strain ATCC 9797 / DSM 5571 / CCUG 30873 / LMG 14455 / NCTC 10739 / 18323) TaxID=568706 RepID=A0A0T7CKE6_BORP1|nr:FAD-binding oxidoreductase [Bordetella pertussis]AZR83797.1 hydroxyacid dehydrogenase [Bordetella pertussis]PNO99853.1 hydroxyacid dehydrogenase [Bordetella pertussis 18323]UEB59949.1 FAD-binding oxidoreductase [Bordetella pertussis]CCJ61981.1 putative oxidoreductase [Bordetella pertussis 18323]CFP50324.1 oxidoreductase [Bordetella pertussis]